MSSGMTMLAFIFIFLMCSQVLSVWFEELGLVTGVVLLGVVYMGIDFRGCAMYMVRLIIAGSVEGVESPFEKP
jgi:hypothetical protein